MSNELATLKELLWSAHYHQHNLAVEVAVSLRQARQSLAEALERAERNVSPRQRQFFENQAQRMTIRVCELEAFQETFASLRGEIGALPVFRDKAAVCEPVIAKWASRLQESVELRTSDFLYRREGK